MAKQIKKIDLSEEQVKELQSIANKRTAPQQSALRSKIILMTAEGVPAKKICGHLKVSKVIVRKWKERFVEFGVEGLKDQARSGAPRKHGPEIRHRIAAEACNPPEGKTHWSIRDLAKHLGVDRGIVERVFKEQAIKPHLVKYYHHSTDPEFEEKMLNIIGLYLKPPENAIVLSVDEKTGIQALDRTQPVLPLQPHGKIKNIPFEYKRNGTTSLLAALDVHSGTITGRCEKRHTNVEFTFFLKELVKKYKRKTNEIHIICDNYSAHKHKNVKQWLGQQENVYMHFTPTHASWLNQIEIWFSIMGRKILKQGIFKSVKDLVRKIKDFIKLYNSDCQPFAWTYTGDPLKVK
jgi:putative transposase